MKTKEELNVLKGEVEALNKKLAELTEEEMKQVSGGIIVPVHEVENWLPIAESGDGGDMQIVLC